MHASLWRICWRVLIQTSCYRFALIQSCICRCVTFDTFYTFFTFYLLEKHLQWKHNSSFSFPLQSLPLVSYFKTICTFWSTYLFQVSTSNFSSAWNLLWGFTVPQGVLYGRHTRTKFVPFWSCGKNYILTAIHSEKGFFYSCKWVFFFVYRNGIWTIWMIFFLRSKERLPLFQGLQALMFMLVRMEHHFHCTRRTKICIQ